MFPTVPVIIRLMERDPGSAIEAVLARITEMHSTPTAIARAAGVDPATVRDFLSGGHWPQSRTRGRLEMALEWPPGTIEDIARGKPTPVISDEPDVTPAGQAALMQTIREVTRDMNPTLLDEFRAQIEAAGRKLRREAGM